VELAMFISVKKCHFALSVESSSSPLSIGVMVVEFYINEFFFSLFPKKLQLGLLDCGHFNFSFYSFNF
jgi:hypothetical protein